MIKFVQIAVLASMVQLGKMHNWLKGFNLLNRRAAKFSPIGLRSQNSPTSLIGYTFNGQSSLNDKMPSLLKWFNRVKGVDN